LISAWTDDLAATTLSRDSTTVQISEGQSSITLPSWSVNVLEVAAP
jgi:hypothetical protein